MLCPIYAGVVQSIFAHLQLLVDVVLAQAEGEINTAMPYTAEEVPLVILSSLELEARWL